MLRSAADDDLVPGGVLDGVVVDDGSPDWMPVAAAGVLAGDVVGVGRAGDVLLRPRCGACRRRS